MLFKRKTITKNARPLHERRAFSLLELVAVTAVLGLIAGMAITRFGHDTLSVTDAEGFVRKLSVSMQVARRQSIAEGSGGVVQLDLVSGVIQQFRIIRDTGAGDFEVDSPIIVPTGVTVTATANRWAFDHTGAITSPTGGGSVTIDAPGWTWTLQLYATTGHCRISRSVAL